MPVSPVALTGSSYFQSFNTLPIFGSASNGQLPQGWDFVETGSGANSTISADDGSSPFGDTYSYGADGSIDRAFGQLSAGGQSILGAVFTNNTDRYMNFTISYTGEQWRSGGGFDRLDFQFSSSIRGATSLTTGNWQDVNALDLVAPSTVSGPGQALNGNAFQNQDFVAGALPVGLFPGTSLYIRWVPSSTFGSGLAIDNFSISTTFYPIPRRNDFNNDHHADILWHNDSGAVSIWNSGQVGQAHIISSAGAVASDWHIAGTGDFDGNGTSDILWRNDNGAASVWFNSDIDQARIITNPIKMAPSWHIAGTGDFYGEGTSGIIWQNDDGAIQIWSSVYYDIRNNVAAGAVPASWHIAGTGDFDGSGSADILWRNDNGAVSIWDSGKIGRAHVVSAAGAVGNDWHIAGTGDFNGDGHDDILWRNDNGKVSIWDSGQASGAHIVASAGVVPTSWHIADTGDYDGDGHADILWRNDNGAVSIWDAGQLGSAHIVASAGNVPTDWHIVGPNGEATNGGTNQSALSASNGSSAAPINDGAGSLTVSGIPDVTTYRPRNDFNGDHHADIAWRNDNGAVSVWNSGQIGGAHIISPAGAISNDWQLAGSGDFNGDHSEMLWHNDNGAVSIWDIGGAHIVASAGVVPPEWHIAV